MVKSKRKAAKKAEDFLKHIRSLHTHLKVQTEPSTPTSHSKTLAKSRSPERNLSKSGAKSRTTSADSSKAKKPSKVKTKSPSPEPVEKKKTIKKSLIKNNKSEETTVSQPKKEKSKNVSKEKNIKSSEPLKTNKSGKDDKNKSTSLKSASKLKKKLSGEIITTKRIPKPSKKIMEMSIEAASTGIKRPASSPLKEPSEKLKKVRKISDSIAVAVKEDKAPEVKNKAPKVKSEPKKEEKMVIETKKDLKEKKNKGKIEEEKKPEPKEKSVEPASKKTNERKAAVSKEKKATDSKEKKADEPKEKKAVDSKEKKAAGAKEKKVAESKEKSTADSKEKKATDSKEKKKSTEPESTKKDKKPSKKESKGKKEDPVVDDSAPSGDTTPTETKKKKPRQKKTKDVAIPLMFTPRSGVPLPSLEKSPSLMKINSGVEDKPLSPLIAEDTTTPTALGKKKSNLSKHGSLKRTLSISKSFDRGECGSLDLALILDITGSMSSWIERAKNTLQEIISEVANKHEDLKARVSFVGYMDFSEGKEHFKIKDFTEDIPSVREFINKQVAFGGGDTPEDVVGGLNRCLALDWKSETKIAFLICDAPTHGRQYHDVFGDNYPLGHPDGITLENMMKSFAERNIHFTAIKLVDGLCDKMFKVMKESYIASGGATGNVDVATLDSIKNKKSELEITKEFVEAAASIISTKINASKSEATALPLWDVSKLSVGNWFSSTTYAKVHEVHGNKVILRNIRGYQWELNKDILENEFYSADHFEEEVFVNKNELAEIIENASDVCLKVHFRKKVNEEYLKKKLKLVDPENVKNDGELNKLFEDLTEGEECTLTGRLVKTEPKLGRSLIVDLNFWSPSQAYRQVDHRTIKWIILRNKKYTYKKEGLKKRKSTVEELLKKDDGIAKISMEDKDLESKTLKVDSKALWNSSKLQKGNWFSTSFYVKVEKINGDKVDVYNSRGYNYTFSRNILENEMYSADHFANEEKTTMTELARILEEARDTIFLVVFNKKLSKESVKSELEKLTKADMAKDSVIKQLSKKFQEGDSVSIVGKLVNSEPRLGRSLVVDLNAGLKNNLRQVDHRTIKSIIFQNTSYSLK